MYNPIVLSECIEHVWQWADIPLSHSWSLGWAEPWDCWGRCCRDRVACRARGAGWGTGCRLYHPGWWTDTASPAASEPAGCGTWWDSPGGTAPSRPRHSRHIRTLDLNVFFFYCVLYCSLVNIFLFNNSILSLNHGLGLQGNQKESSCTVELQLKY